MNATHPAITVDHLTKHYSVHTKQPGFLGSLASLVHRTYETVQAVVDISFTIEPGELVGFIGPNGAGKTTTLKCMSGLLHPTEGNISVLGYEPFQRKHEFLQRIALVMGQKNQLWWDLPAQDTLLLNKEIYSIPDKRYTQSLTELVDLLDVSSILDVQVRKLSLGQRMKMEFIAALIHQPRVLFLDEPTIGLDVVMQKKVRDFIAEYNARHGATILLTSHYMEDVRQLASRVIVIDRGTIIYDGKLQTLVQKYAKNKVLTVHFNGKPLKKLLPKHVIVESWTPQQAVLTAPRKDVSHVASHLLQHYDIDDLNIEEPDIEDVIRDVFREGSNE